MSIAAGVAFLDQHKPGWHDLIDLASLDLGSNDQCVLGQLYGSFGAGVEAVADGEGICAKLVWAGSRGFYAMGEDADVDLDEEYAALTAGWAKVIADRRGESVA